MHLDGRLLLSVCVVVVGAAMAISAGAVPLLQQPQKKLATETTMRVKLRHQHRYPHLDRVMNKLEDASQVAGSDTRWTTTKSSGPRYHYNRVPPMPIHTTTTTKSTLPPNHEGLLYEDDYDEGDDDDDDDDEEEENNYEADDAWDEDEPIEDDYEDYRQEKWQNEQQGTTTTDQHRVQSSVYQPRSSSYSSSLTDFKWKHYGTRADVEESRRQQLHLQPTNQQRAISAVVEHYVKVRQEGQCLSPVRKVISVQSVHPDSSKTYTPQCTILYRCSEDTGCCSNVATKCAPKTQEIVNLYFYSKTLGVSDTKVERLSFFNHTECGCLEKSQIGSPITVDNLKVEPYTTPNHQPIASLRRCRCPKEFVARSRHYDSNSCSCECNDENEDCMGMSRGNEYLSLTDRKCILDGKCGVPKCEYGAYLKQIGRCQKKQERVTKEMLHGKK